MAKFMFHGSYTASGAAGVLKDGGSGRMKALDALAASVGGSIESAYWALGTEDFYITVELPDNKAAAALSLTVAASGAVRISTAELFSAADVDEIASRRVTYRAPGA
ncbi:MAG: GYD domain-containing protein [Chloroflexota bacterium]|nr:MAG: GYD domain-containing protein [Chloroflexota bacterium]